MTATATDPTLEFMARFEDESNWDHVERNIPIFAEHDLYILPSGARVAVPLGGKAPADGQFSYRVDEARLRRIADTVQRMQRDTGTPVKIIDGHTAPPGKVPQSQQPKIFGYYWKVRYGHWGPKRKPGILADAYYRKGAYAEAREYPERSAEFYSKTDEIKAVAHLKTDAVLCLGAVATYARDAMTAYARSDGAVCYMRGPDMAEEHDTPPPKDPTEVPGDDGKPDPVFAEHFGRCVNHQFPHLGRLHAEAAEKYGAGPGVAAPAIPGPLNTGLPGGPVPPPQPKEPAMNMGRADVPEHYARAFEEQGQLLRQVVEENKLLKGQVGDLRTNYAREKVHGDLTKRKDDGVVKLQDPAFFGAEWNRQTTLYGRDPAEQAARLQEMDDCWEHQHDPTRNGHALLNYGRTADETVPAAEPDFGDQLGTLDAAMQYMREHPDCTDYEQAKAGVHKQRTARAAK